MRKKLFTKYIVFLQKQIYWKCAPWRLHFRMFTNVDNSWVVLSALEIRFVILVTNCQFNLHTSSFQPLNLLFVFIVSNHFIRDAVPCIYTAYIELSFSIAIFYVVGQSQAPITTSLLLNSKNHFTSPLIQISHYSPLFIYRNTKRRLVPFHI